MVVSPRASIIVAYQRHQLGGNRAVTFELTTAFNFIGDKKDSVRVRRRKTVVFSSARTNFDENIGLTGCTPAGCSCYHILNKTTLPTSTT